MTVYRISDEESCCVLDVIMENATKDICGCSKKDLICIKSHAYSLSHKIVECNQENTILLLVNYQIDSNLKYKDMCSGCIYQTKSSSIRSVYIELPQETTLEDQFSVDIQVEYDNACVYAECDIYKNIVVCICANKI